MIGLLGSMLGGRSGRMLGGMVGGRYGAMLGGLAGAMLGGRNLGRLGGLLKRNRNDDSTDADSLPPSFDDAEAAVLIRAMCNAAKADGEIDPDEQGHIVGELDDSAEDELAFLRAELDSPFLPAGTFAGEVPANLAAEAYAVSLVTIQVDTVEEASYLRDLRDALGLSHADVDEIHDNLSVARL